MNRLIAAGLFALPALCAAGPDARANYPCPHLGCGGFCFKFLGGLHQHGPLYNYGPYAGYYPFEPYGPWNSQLQYTGPYPSGGACGWNGLCGKCGHRCGAGGVCGNCGHGWGRHGPGLGLGDGCNGCSGWGRYARTTFSNVGNRIFPLFHRHRSAGCDSCGSWPQFAPGGCGTCGGGVAAAEKPAEVNPVQQTGYPRTER